MSTEQALPNIPELNIDAAKKYVTSAEVKLVSDPAKKALNELKEALQIQTTQDKLIDLAKLVESAQGNDKTGFTVEEFKKQITQIDVPVTEVTPEKNEILPRNATAEYIVEKVYETGNETLIDGAEILLGTLNDGLETFALTPHEKENIKIGILGYVFDHYYEALGGIKISDLNTIFTDITKTFKTVGSLTKGGLGGVMSDPKGKFDAVKELTQGGNESLSKVTNLLDNTTSIEDRVTNHIAQKFGLLTELLAKKRPLANPIPSEPDSLSGFLSDPQNLIDIETKFPAKTVEEFEQQIQKAPQLGLERTVEMAGRLKKVFENKAAILDKVTGTGKNILDMFADSPDAGGPMSWGRDMIKGVLKFLSGLPFIGNFLKTLLGVDASEDIESYFGDEKRFQRLSAKSLRSLSESKNSILSGKNLINVTTKRLAPFTKAYMPLLMTPDQKIPAIDAQTWSQIIDEGKIPVIQGKEKVFISIPDNQRINEGDFLHGKPEKTFFNKINALTEVLAGKTPETPTKKTESLPGTVPNAAPSNPELPTPLLESVEGKTKSEIADIIIKKGKELLPKAQKKADDISGDGAMDAVKKTLLLQTISSIKSALDTSNIDALKNALKILNDHKTELPSEDQQSLGNINTLISAWEKASDAQTTPIAKTDTAEKVIPKEAKKESSWQDAAKDMATASLDWMKNQINAK